MLIYSTLYIESIQDTGKWCNAAEQSFCQWPNVNKIVLRIFHNWNKRFKSCFLTTVHALSFYQNGHENTKTSCPKSPCIHTIPRPHNKHLATRQRYYQMFTQNNHDIGLHRFILRYCGSMLSFYPRFTLACSGERYTWHWITVLPILNPGTTVNATDGSTSGAFSEERSASSATHSM